MSIEHLIQQDAYTGVGYSPVVDYGAWRVAVLNFHPELLPENISHFQCHRETDEVFVLLSGTCRLYVAEPHPEDPDRIETIHAVDMKPKQIYTIRRGVYHSHTPSEDASILIVENRDTGDVNSNDIELTEAQRTRLQETLQEI